MTVKDFLLPDLGEGLTEGELVSWLVAVGDAVDIDQPVAEVETAKAVVEVPSPFAGTVATLHAEPGQEIIVGEPLVSIDTAGGSAADAPSPKAGEQPANAGVTDAIPDAEEAVEDDDASGNVLVGYGTGGGGRARRRRAGAPQEVAAAAVNGAAARPKAKPPVRKLAKDLGVDLVAVTPSGGDGVITRDDVRAAAGAEELPVAARAGEVPASSAPAAALAPPVVAAGPTPPSADLVERRPLKGMRKAIATQMTTSRREIPEAVTWVDVDATELMDLRAELNASQSDVKVTPLALVMRCVVAGLREFPEVNSRLDVETNEVVVQRFVNLGFATQTAAGLMVPVIHGADRLSTLGIAAELNRLAAAGRDRSLSTAELGGSTFTVSNYGSFGVDGGDPVINFPEAAIMGVGRIVDKPWVVDGALAVRKVTQLSVAFDHRICDGGEAAGFLRYVADLIESPTRLLGAL